MTLITTLAYAALTAHLILDKAGLDPRDLPRRVRYAWLRARIKLGV